MGIRDTEISRLIKYSEGLGIRVSFRKHKKNVEGAAWCLNEDDSVDLIIYEWPGVSKTRIILNFLHELAHHKSWVANNRKLSKKVIDALCTEGDVSKRKRKLIYETEKKDAEYRLEIWHELGLKVPEWKVKVDIALDNWVYYIYYQENRIVTDRELDQKAKELKEIYEPKL